MTNVTLINWHIKPQQTPLGKVPCDGLNAAYEGLRKSGVNVKRVAHSVLAGTDIVVCWGWKRQIAERFKLLKKQVLVIELGYIGDRTKNISIGWNGLNGYAAFPEYPSDNGERFYSMGGKLKSWKTGGDYILILGQVKGDASLKGKDISSWYRDCAKKAKEVYGLPVYFRPHPESRRRRGYESIKGIENIGGSLEDALSGALFTIAYNSNSCLDSILAGVPCYAGDRGTVAWELCMSNLAELYYPERENVVYQIAWKQWTLDEIKSGLPFYELFK